MAPAGMVAEIGIETYDTMHFGTGYVEGQGDHLFDAIRHIAEFFLHPVQDRQHWPFQMQTVVNDSLHTRRLICGDSTNIHEPVLPNRQVAGV